MSNYTASRASMMKSCRAVWAVFGILSMCSILLTSVFAQQGNTSAISLPRRVPTDDSYAGALVRTEEGLYAAFISGNTVYTQRLQDSTTIAYPAPYSPLKVRAARRIRGTGDVRVAGLFTLPSGGSVIGFHDGQSWQWYDAPNATDVALSSRGDIFYCTAGNPVYLYRISSEGGRELIASLDTRDAPSNSGLSISTDGSTVAVNYMVYIRVLNTLVPFPQYYLRVEYSQGEGTRAVAEGFFFGMHAVVAQEGGFVADAGAVRSITIDPDSGTLLLTPVETYTARIPVDFSNGRIVYVDPQGFLRVLDMGTRIDLPIAPIDNQNIRGVALWGEHILFDTVERILPEETDDFRDVFVYNLSTQQFSGVTVGSQPVDGLSSDVAVGATPSFVAFTSDSRNLVPDKTTPYPDAFIFVDGHLERVRGSDGTEPNGPSFTVSVARSGQGQLVAFASHATNLVLGDDNAVADIFVWDATTRRLACLTCEWQGGDSYSPVVAPDNTIYFLSATTSTGVSSVPQAYQWRNNAIQLVRSPEGTEFESVENIAVSPNGQYVVLTARRTEDEPYRLFVYNGDLHFIREIASSNPDADLFATDVSDNGLVVLQTTASLHPDDTDGGMMDVYVTDGDVFYLVSRNPVGGKGNADSFGGSIDASGRYVAFTSLASNLVPADLNNEEDVFVYDLAQDWLYCASRNRMGLPVGGSRAQITSTGSHLVFITGSPELVWMPFSAGVFTALHQIGCTPPGDVNMDGQVDDSDLLAVLFSFGTTDVSLADINVDGRVDDADLLVVLFNFGTGCSFGWAGGGGDDEDPEESGPELVRLGSGRAILYYPTTPHFTQFAGGETQRLEIDRAVAGLWPYPVAGGLVNPWRETFGSALGWSKDSILRFRALIDPQSTGDFRLASGNVFSHIWSDVYSFQPSSNTYIRFRPEIKFEARACEQFMRFDGTGTLDLKVLGIGQDGIASFKCHAGMTPGWLGYKVEAFLRGQKIWDDGWYSQQSSWSWNRTYNLASFNIASGAYNFTIAGVPCTAYFSISAFANASLGFFVQLFPSIAQASFTPNLGANMTLTGGVGGSVAGVTVAVGAQLNFSPFLQLSLPTNASMRIESRRGGGCDLVAEANVSLTLRALAGNLRVGLFTSCIGGWPFCKKCSSGESKPIFRVVPAKCCDESCGSRKKKRRIDASFQVASWSGLNYNLATILNTIWRWPIK